MHPNLRVIQLYYAIILHAKISDIPFLFFLPLFYRRHTKEFFLSASLPFSSASLCPRPGQKENIIPLTCVILTTPWALASKRNNQHFLCYLVVRRSLFLPRLLSSLSSVTVCRFQKSCLSYRFFRTVTLVFCYCDYHIFNTFHIYHNE